MTPERAKELLPIIQAFADGRTIQIRKMSGEWEDVDQVHSNTALVYRIKPAKLFRWYTPNELMALYLRGPFLIRFNGSGYIEPGYIAFSRGSGWCIMTGSASIVSAGPFSISFDNEIWNPLGVPE